MCQRILRDRVKSYDIMKHYVKEKKKLCTFPIYSIRIMFVLVQLVFTLFLSSRVIVYLFFTLFMFISPEDQCNSFLSAVYSAFLLMIVILI